MFSIQVAKNRMALTSKEYMTSGSKNVYVCQFEFSSEWEGLEKVAVFATAMGESAPLPDSVYNQLLGDDNRCFIPWEVTKEANTSVYIGVFGTMNEEIVLPTVWMDIGTILLGVTTGLDLEPPTPQLYEQILAQLKAIKDEVGNIESGSALTVMEDQTITSGKNLAEQYPCAVVFVNSTISAPGKARAAMNWALYSEPIYLEDLPYSDTENAIFMTDMRGLTYAFTYAKDDPEKVFVDMVEVETRVSVEAFKALAESVNAKVNTTDYDAFKQEINTKVDNIELTPGPVGPAGANGADGADGKDGVIFTPSVSEDGTLSWTNDGSLENPPPVNIRGSAGADGQNGVGVPAGGTTGQVLSKKTTADYDTQWIDPPQGGGSGGDGQQTYLVKAPVGTIVIWSGTADNIPSGWQLCDGTNGTPDLRDKFVLGAGTNHAVGETGGSEDVTLTVEQMPSHSHSYYYRSGAGTAGGSGKSFATDSRSSQSSSKTGGDQPHPNMPPYYALCYIMKLTADEIDGVTMDQVNAAIKDALGTIEMALSEV